MKKLFCIILLISTCTENNLHAKHAISYGFSGGRFGDNIMGYCQARYISHITSLPFLYRPFDFSNQLTIEYGALPYAQYASKYPRQFSIKRGDDLTEFIRQIRNPNTPNTLFIIEYLPYDFSFWVAGKTIQTLIINIPWKDTGFSQIVHNTIKPRIAIPDFTCKNRLNVAVHVRTLSGKDTVTSLIGYPLKHPTTEYHKQQIEKVYMWNLKRPMYVFLFSDTKTPHALLEEFRQRFQGCDIVFDIQNLKAPDLNNTIQDFFAMQKFDVLIATQSNYSMMAALIGTFDMVILPMHVQGEYPHYRITQVHIISKKSNWFPYELDFVLKN